MVAQQFLARAGAKLHEEIDALLMRISQVLDQLALVAGADLGEHLPYTPGGRRRRPRRDEALFGLPLFLCLYRALDDAFLQVSHALRDRNKLGQHLAHRVKGRVLTAHAFILRRFASTRCSAVESP